MKDVISAFYGNVKLLKKYCELCKMYAFVIDKEFQCCGRRDFEDYIEVERIKHKRESDCSGKRGFLSKADKNYILTTQNNKCAYCSCDLRKESIHFDHFIPFSFEWSEASILNIVAACSDCNQLKSNRIYESIEDVSEDVKDESIKRKGLRKIRRQTYVI